jgi:hypothetical protein
VPRPSAPSGARELDPEHGDVEVGLAAEVVALQVRVAGGVGVVEGAGLAVGEHGDGVPAVGEAQRRLVRDPVRAHVLGRGRDLLERCVADEVQAGQLGGVGEVLDRRVRNRLDAVGVGAKPVVGRAAAGLAGRRR